MMTPEEFAKAMREIYPEPLRCMHDTATSHVYADELMEKVLISLGYENGIEIFREAVKWYA